MMAERSEHPDHDLIKQAADSARATERTLERVEAQLVPLTEAVERHRAEIYDGRYGLNNRVSRLEDRVTIAAAADRVFWAKIALLAAAMSGVIEVLVKALQ